MNIVQLCKDVKTFETTDLVTQRRVAVEDRAVSLAEFREQPLARLRGLTTGGGLRGRQQRRHPVYLVLQVHT